MITVSVCIADRFPFPFVVSTLIFVELIILTMNLHIFVVVTTT